MAGKSNEIDLVIRARNEASKTLQAVVSAFNDFKSEMNSANTATGKANAVMGALGKTIAVLNKDARGLQALGEISKNMDQAAGAVGRLETSVREGVASFAELARKTQEAEQNLARLRGQVGAEENAMKAATAARRDSNRELGKAETALKQALAAQEKLNAATDQSRRRSTRGVGADIGAPQTSARSSAAVFLEADVAKAQSNLRSLQNDVAAYTAEIDKSAKTVAELAPRVKVAADNEKRLSNELKSQTAELRANKAALGQSREELSQIKDIAQQAAAATGRQVTSQQQVTAAYAATAAEIERMTRLSAAMSKFSTGSGDFADPKTAAVLQKQNQVVQEAQGYWKTLESEARRLSVSLRSVSGNATEQVDAFKRIIDAARKAKTEYFEQVDALDKLRSAAGLQVSGLNRVAQAATVASQRLNTVSQALPPIRAMASATQSLGQASQQAAAGTTSLGSSLGGLTNSSRTSLSLMQRIRGEVLALTAGYVGLQGAISNIGGVLNAFQTLEAAQARLNVAFNSNPERVSAELAFLERSAQRLGVSFEVLSTQYSKFAVAAQSANFSSAATRDIFLSVAEAGRVQRLSVDQLEGVFKALEQMISKGKVQAEELRGQLGDRMTGAFKLFADAIGVTTAQLDEMLKKGEVIANEDMLGKVGERLRKTYGPELGNALAGTTAEIGRFQDNLFQAELRVGEGGFVEAFTELLRKLNEGLRSREGRDFFLTLGSALAKVTEALTAALPYFDEVGVALLAIAGIKVAQFFAGFVTGLRNSATATVAGNAAMFTWRGTVAATQAQWNGLVGALTVGTGALARLRTELTVTAALAPRVGAGFVAMRVGLTALQTVAGVTAGVFRTLWAAIGGIPGLILTGVTLAIGSWLTSVDGVTSAVDEHKRLMGEVLAEYDKVKGKTDEWRDAVGGVSLIELERSFRNITTELESSTKKLKSSIAENLRGGIFNGLTFGLLRGDEQKQLDQMLESFLRGEINVKQLRQGIADLNLELKDDAVKAAIGDIDELAKSAEDLGTKQEEAAVAAKALKSQSEEIGSVADGSGKSLKDLAGVTEDGKTANVDYEASAKKVSESLDGMAKFASNLSDELERLGRIDALNKLYQDGLKAAGSMGEVYKLTQQYNQSLSSITAGSLGAGGDLVSRIVGIESGGRADARNPNSSATGAGQFIESTWLRMFKQYFPDLAVNMNDAQIKDLRLDAGISKQMVALYAQENAKILQAAGIATTDANLYLAHFLGPGGAKNLLSAAPNTPVSDVLSADQIAANQSILGGKDVSEVVAWAERKMGISREELAIQTQISEEDRKQQEATQKRIADGQAEVEKQRLIADGKAREAAILEAERQARAENKNITDEQLAKVRELAGAEFDLTNRTKEQKTEQQGANALLREAQALYQQRNALQDLYQQQLALGDTGAADQTSIKLADVNTRLNEAIAKARAMWEAIGGPAADAALAKLDTLSTKVQTATTKTNSFGLTGQQVTGFVDSFATGIANAFGSFAQAAVNGENAFAAFGRAVLQTLAQIIQELAVAIIRQQILNSLANMGGGGGGGGFLGTIASAAKSLLVAHEGATVGAGTRSRSSISAGVFAGAMRYHTGGVAGLKPNEVPAILEKGETIRTQAQEEALTERQLAAERASGQQAGPQTLRNIVVLDEQSAANWLGSAAGEKVVWGMLSQNKAKLRGLVSG